MVTLFAPAAAYAINNPVRNCELSDPSISISAGFRGPFILIGRCPLLEVISIPIAGNISSKKCIGLLSKLPVPLIISGLLLNAASGVNILIPNPLSPQLIDEDTGATPLLLIMISLFVLLIICAPSFETTSIAARSSLEDPGLNIVVVPFDNKAAAHARCIELLDAGAC